MNISANKLVDAINSSSKSDDKELLEEVFSGDDTFVSKYSFNSKNYYSPTGDDIPWLWDDTFQPDKGDDFIDGGDGFDTVIIGGLKSSYTLSYDTATETAVLNSSYYGKKSLKNIENVEFKPSSLSDSTNKYSINDLFPDINNSNSNNNSNINMKVTIKLNQMVK